MTTDQRIQMCLLIEKMNGQRDYSKKLGLEDKSTFHGRHCESGSWKLGVFYQEG